MNELSKYTDKELRQELYMRNKKNKISEKDKEKCLNCVHRICYSKAIRLEKKHLLPFKFDHFMYKAICLKRHGTESWNKDYHLSVSNNTKGCDLFKNKKNYK